MFDGQAPIDWIVMRNRLGHVEARNKRAMTGLLTQLAKRIGFRLVPGFGERVVFRELFLKGLTLLDLREDGTGVALNMSHVAARQEVRALLQAIALRAGVAHRRSPPCRRMRGSSAASAMSDRNMPMTVSIDRNIRNDPARYMS